ncbi:MAG: hypothetical protein IPM97_04770 [Bdellovibrionaceae bacterium]|nr:hypothetical protein [Pseudobdellovibrionaceae bacterium]
MKTHQGVLSILFFSFAVGCASVATKNFAPGKAEEVSTPTTSKSESVSSKRTFLSPPALAAPDHVLICKAKKNRFNFDWSAASIGSEQIDQNSIRYQFKPAKKPAGERGENLKIGECGWAGSPLAKSKRAPSEFVMKSLSNESTEAFYRMKTGRVFKLPVRQSASGMVVLPKAEVSVVR